MAVAPAFSRRSGGSCPCSTPACPFVGIRVPFSTRRSGIVSLHCAPPGAATLPEVLAAPCAKATALDATIETARRAAKARGDMRLGTHIPLTCLPTKGGLLNALSERVQASASTRYRRCCRCQQSDRFLGVTQPLQHSAGNPCTHSESGTGTRLPAQSTGLCADVLSKSNAASSSNPPNAGDGCELFSGRRVETLSFRRPPEQSRSAGGATRIQLGRVLAG